VTDESEEVERFEGLVGRRCGRFRVRDVRVRDVMVDELRVVYVQSVVRW
jgi:hypothetical protein